MKKVKTDNIQIIVEPAYLPERSDPTKPIYMFSYKIKIKNTGTETVQLKSRYWHITDGNGNVEEIRGPGVVGNQPYLKNGERFEYTSFCPLRTEFGIMKGTYQMVSDNGETFDAEVPVFHLVTPHAVN